MYLSVKCMAFINDFLSLIYPRLCEACTGTLFGHEQVLCGRCLLGLPKSGYHHSASSELTMVFAGRVPVEKAASLFLFEKSGRVQRLLHALKYEGQEAIGEYLGRLCAQDLEGSAFLGDIDLVLPVPLHKKKLRARGYNQSESFARGLALAASKPLHTTLLERVVETSTQTKKRKYQRWENVEGIFRLNQPESLAGKHVLLVDDVITTGATIEAAWQALRQAGNVRVSLLSIAFAARHV